MGDFNVDGRLDFAVAYPAIAFLCWIPNLVLVEADQAFGGLEGLLDAPALPGHGDQGAQRHRPR